MSAAPQDPSERRSATTLPVHVEVLSPEAVRDFDGPEWYDMADESHVWMRWRMAEAEKLWRAAGIDPTAPLRALDVGGGTGVVRARLEALTNWSVDLDELDVVALAASAPGRGRTIHYDIMQRRAELHEAYDVVVLFDVLEHIEDTAPFLDALLWHLRPGGHLLINVPALPSGRSRFDDVVGHVRRYTMSSLLGQMPWSVDVVCARRWGMALVPAVFARKALLATLLRHRSRADVVRSGFAAPGPIASGLLDALMNVELRRRSPAPFGTSLMLCARKRP